MAEEKSPQTILAEAIRRRDELNAFIKVYQEMSGAQLGDDLTGTQQKPQDASPQGDVADPMTVVYPGLFFGKTQPQAVRLLLERVKRPLKTRVIVECLKKGGLEVGGKKPAINLWGILNRNSEIFVLVPKAGWGLMDWYDPKTIAKMREEGDKDSEEGNGNEKDG